MTHFGQIRVIIDNREQTLSYAQGILIDSLYLVTSILEKQNCLFGKNRLESQKIEI